MSNKRKKDTNQVLSMSVVAVFFIFTLVFGVYVNSLKIVPTKYMFALFAVLIILNVIVAVLLLTKSRKWKKILSAVVVIISVAVLAYFFKTFNSLDYFIDVTTEDEDDQSIYSIVVLVDDELQSTDQVKDMQIAYELKADLKIAAKLLPNNIGAPARSYVSYPSLVDSLYDGNERIILFDESFRALINDTHPDFFKDTKILASTDNEYMLGLISSNTKTDESIIQPSEIIQTTATTAEMWSSDKHPTPNPSDYTIETVDETAGEIDIIEGEGDEGGEQIEGPVQTNPSNQAQEPEQGNYEEYYGSTVSGTKPFTLFITGIDTYGGIDTRSRSDVNIAAAINPNTRQVLLVPIPRDSYVPIAGTGGYMDKITHAGILGANSSANSAANVLHVPMDSYLKVNFSTLIRSIDVLGGITIYNPHAFTSVSGYNFPAGNIRLNGAQALSYSRERKAFASGDFARGVNQTRVIKGIIDEVSKPQNILNANALLQSMRGTFRTNMPDSAMRVLIKNQLSNGGSWNVQTYSLSGYVRSGLPSYFMPQYRLSFIVLDQGSLANARGRMYSILQ